MKQLSLKQLTRLLFIILFPAMLAGNSAVYAQCSGPNLLTNPSFEDPVVNNQYGASNVVASIPGWTNGSTGGTTVNILRPDGIGSYGPNNAADGSQYIDLPGTTGIMNQSFTLSSPAMLAFSGKFANRNSANASYAQGEGGIQIINSDGAVVATHSVFTAKAQGDNIWLTNAGLTSVLPAGNYVFRFFGRSDYMHYDNMSLCIATNAAQSCLNRKVLKPESGWSATASGSAGNLVPPKAIDGSTKDAATQDVWATSTDPGAGQYITFNYGTPRNLVGFIYYPRTGANQNISDYTVQYSNDGVAFTTIQSGSIAKQVSLVGNPLEVNFTSAVTAQYLRLIINATYENSYGSIAELLPIVCDAPTLPVVSCTTAGLLNTGTNATGDGLKTLDTFDANWEAAYVPGNAGSTYATVANATFVPAIVAGNKIPNNGASSWSNSPFGNANWISFTQTAYDAFNHTPNTASDYNDYFFRYRFTITDPYILPAFKLKLNFMADNEVENVYINGVGQAPQPNLPQAAGDYLYYGFQLANQSTTTLQNNWKLGDNEVVVHVKSKPGAQGFLGQNIVTCPGLDYGDAPASYNVSKAANGAGHVVETDNNGIVTLKLGNLIDPESDGTPSAGISDNNTGLNDEDGVASFPTLPANGTTASYTLQVTVANSTGSTANLCGWIDWNVNGVFDAGESVCTTVPNGATSAQLVWPAAAPTAPGASLVTYARIRITTDALAGSNANGPASNGEVEDYQVTIPPGAIIKPDLTPTITMPSTTLSAGSSKDFVVKLSEIKTIATSSQIAFNLVVPAGYTLTMDPSAVSVSVTGAGNLPVTNGQWDVITTGTNQLDLISKPGVVINAGSFAQLGFRILRNSATTAGSGNIVISIYPDPTMTYDSDNANNLYNRTITGN